MSALSESIWAAYRGNLRVKDIAAAFGLSSGSVSRHLRKGGFPPMGVGGRPPIVRIIGEILPPRVDRDPCQRCGARRDAGCGHSLAPLSMGAWS